MMKTMPGVTGPFGLFDPLGFATNLSEAELLLRRESELAHGRVAMVGALGFLVQEGFHPIFPGVDGPAINQLTRITEFSDGQAAFFAMSVAIASAELARARYGWVEPDNLVEGGSRLQEGYTPGDLGFDPLGLKPAGAADFLAMQDKELNNGRLAMIAVAGMIGQELVTQRGLFGA
jgi:light-harvesting complex I chlorophyll a/b binding protein 4